MIIQPNIPDSITTPSGCSVVDTLLVKMRTEAPIIVSDLFVPKAWTPNGDGHNDKLYPLTLNIVELKYFRIFNRWGQLMFETNVLGFGWDGIYTDNHRYRMYIPGLSKR